MKHSGQGGKEQGFNLKFNQGECLKQIKVVVLPYYSSKVQSSFVYFKRGVETEYWNVTMLERWMSFDEANQLV